MYNTEQENFWKGEFGTNYIERNTEEECFSGKVAFWSKILSKTNNIKSCIEYGANIGLNLKALNLLNKKIELNAVEINDKAVDTMKKDKEINVNIFHDSILNVDIEDKYDLTFTMGVLIHINPSELPKVYKKMYETSRKYILIAEYYNTSPVEIEYRGYENKLFKRDFAGEFMDIFPDCELQDYGFLYHRDYNFPMDDINWFLMRKV